MFFQNFGIWQILLILLVILILFGVGKLPEVGRGLGKAISEFRSNVRDDDKSDATKRNADKSDGAAKKDDK